MSGHRSEPGADESSPVIVYFLAFTVKVKLVSASRAFLQRLGFVALVLVVTVSVRALITQESARVPLSAESLSRSTGIYEFGWSPDSRSLAFVSTQGGTSEIWVVDAGGDAPRRITSDGLPKSDPRWSPDGAWVAYVVVQPGGQGDIHAIPADGGPVRILTEAAANETAPRWAPDGTRLAYVSDAGGTPSLMVFDLERGEAVERTSIPTWNPVWSPDSQWIAFGSNPLPNDERRANEDIFIVPSREGEPRLLTPGTQRYRDSSPSFAPDSTRIVYVSEQNGYSNLYTVSVDGSNRAVLNQAQRDQFHPRWSPDGTTIAFVENDAHDFQVWTIPADSAAGPVRLSDRPGVNGGYERADSDPHGTLQWSPDGTRLAFTHSSPARTSDIWVAVSGARATQITNSMPAELRQERRFVAPETMSYPSFDGTRVEAILYRPTLDFPEERPPAVLFFRDNLEGQIAFSWNPFIQMLVSNGYLVFAPNVRGSSGRGEEYRQSIFGSGGDADIRDALIGLDRLSGDGLIDAERLAVFGAGTGGFLTAAAVTRDSTRFKAAVSIQGVVDLVTASSYPAMREWTRYMLGAAPIAAPRPYYERSLTNFVSSLRTPIIFLYGDRDPFAPVQQIEQFAVQAEVAGKWFDYRIFEDEPHGWQRWRPSSLRTAMEATEALLETYLMDRDQPVILTRNR